MSDKTRGLSGMFRAFSARAALHAGSAVMRFPVAVLLIIAFSVVANLIVRDVEGVDQLTVLRVLAMLSGGAAASVAVRLAAESRGASGKTLILAPLGAAALAALAIRVGAPFALNAPALVTALILVIPLAPFAGRGTPGEFWTFALWTALGVGLAFLSVALVVLGLAAILEMVRYLFDFGLGSDAYEHIFTTAFTLIGPLFALGRVPVLEEIRAWAIGDDRLAVAVRSLAEWVAAPLILATALILHLYAGRILITGELPRGQVGWIVTFFLISVLALRIAVDPFTSGGAAPTRLFARIWTVALVIPLTLLAYAIWLRVAAHGFTLERYFLALGGVAAGVCVLLQLLPRLRGDIRVLAAVPVILIALSGIGPWGAPSVVGRSQAARLAVNLGRVPGGDFAKMDEELRQEMRSRIDALDEVEQLDRVVALVPASRRDALRAAVTNGSNSRSNAVATALGIDPEYALLPQTRSFTASRDRELELGGFDRALIGRWISREGEPRAEGEPPSLRFSGDDLVVRQSAVDDRFVFASFLRGLPDSVFNSNAEQTEAPVFDLVSVAGRKIRVRLDSITVEGDGKIPQSGILTVLVRTADWPTPSLRGDR